MKVLFVCTGNLCRSPAAELMLRRAGGTGFEARSRGTEAQAYTTPPRQVTGFLEKLGVPSSGHKPALIREEDVNWADLILAMENHHLEALAEKFPQSSRKAALFLDYCNGSSGAELRDPMGESDRVYEKVLEEIRRGIENMLKRKP